jgi:hypothetical protein
MFITIDHRFVFSHYLAMSQNEVQCIHFRRLAHTIYTQDKSVQVLNLEEVFVIQQHLDFE